VSPFSAQKKGVSHLLQEFKLPTVSSFFSLFIKILGSKKGVTTLIMQSRSKIDKIVVVPSHFLRDSVNARNTCTILRHTLHVDLFFGHNFYVLSPNDSRFIDKVLMTIAHFA